MCEIGSYETLTTQFHTMLPLCEPCLFPTLSILFQTTIYQNIRYMINNISITDCTKRQMKTMKQL